MCKIFAILALAACFLLGNPSTANAEWRIGDRVDWYVICHDLDSAEKAVKAALANNIEAFADLLNDKDFGCYHHTQVSMPPLPGLLIKKIGNRGTMELWESDSPVGTVYGWLVSREGPSSEERGESPNI